MQRSIVTKIADLMQVSNDSFLLAAPFESEPLPGQFVMLSFGDGRTDPFLPRPISIFDWDDGMLTLLIRVVGRGTLLMAHQAVGMPVRVTGPLGNSFPDEAGRVFFIGGGIGIAPLYYAAKRSNAKNKAFILGFRSAEQSYLTDDYLKVADTHFVSDDGSLGVKLFPHEKLDALVKAGEKPDLVIACGPEKMMAAVHEVAKKHGIRDHHSLESRMGCGIGACLGCRVQMPGASVLVCKEGPVFDGSIFEEKK